MVSQVTGLWLVFGSFCPQDYLEFWGEVRLPAHVGWSEPLFPPGSSWVALHLQLCLVSSTHSKVGQFNFESSLVPRDWLWDSLPALLWEFGLLPHPLLRFCCFTHISSLRVWYWEFGFLSLPCSLGQVQHSTSISTVGVRLQFTVHVFQFCWGRGGSVCLGAALDYFPEEWVGEWSRMAGRNCSAFFFSVAWGREASHGLRVQDVAKFDSD
jgi:hypothetical protein